MTLESVRFLEYTYTVSIWRFLLEENMEYLTSAEFAKKWNVSQRRVAIYCKEGRIKGAVLKGRMWMIPADAKKPGDPRKAHKAE